ncbi:MAG: hypothetical protein FJ083_06455 [Cyanobacteria bacterium K_Offshore_surface_m2_239]|nr:hypothetical protein [Cyanobacteria bacterium K_Offshore_surface_m2_239]
MNAARAGTPPTAFCGASRLLGCVGWAAWLQRDLGRLLSHEQTLVCGLEQLALALPADGGIPIVRMSSARACSFEIHDAWFP